MNFIADFISQAKRVPLYQYFYTGSVRSKQILIEKIVGGSNYNSWFVLH